VHIHIQMKRLGALHDKYYKILLLIPAVLLLISLISIGMTYSKTGDLFAKDISLTGGTTVTLNGQFDIEKLTLDLENKLPELNVRRVYDLVSNEEKAVIIETTEEGSKTKEILEDYIGYELTGENSSFEFTGSSLSESFYSQLMLAILIAFIFMGIVVFIIFRSFVPSTAVIISAFADIVMTLALVNMLGMKMSSAGIVAFLMLIGYSVDTDILLTTRILKRSEGSLNRRIWGAFKTGSTMTLTSLFAVLFALFVVKSFSIVLTQIFTILVIGLFFDLLNTWVTNASMLKWYVEAKK
jgi:preprotein translocase subunit SecF